MVLILWEIGENTLLFFAAILTPAQAPNQPITAVTHIDFMPGHLDAVPALIQALSDPDRGVRQAAVKALGRIGPGAQAAVPALSRALKKGSGPEAQEAILLINGGKLDTTSGDPIVPKQ